MWNIILNNWNGGISNHYHTGQINQCSDIKNIDISAHPDAIMLANTTTKIAETNGKIKAWLNMQEYIKHENAGLVWVTDNGEIWYENQKIHTEPTRKYLQIFYDNYTENRIKKVWIFVMHETGIDRMEYSETENIFKNFSRDIDNFKIKANPDEKIPLLKWNGNIFLWIWNQIVSWDGVIFQNKIKLSELTKIVGLTAYGDYVHIYATDGETSYKAIYDPINDEEQPWSIRNFGKIKFLWAIENANVDIVITDNDEIFQSSGLQIQKYISAEKNIFREDKNFCEIIANRDEKIFIWGEKFLYILETAEVWGLPKIYKYDLGGKINFLYWSLKNFFIGYEASETSPEWQKKNFLGKISNRAGENVAEEGEYITLFYKAKKYWVLTGLDIEANFGGKSGWSIEVYARTNIVDDWTKLVVFDRKKWIQETDKHKLLGKIANWHEIQLKIILKKSEDGKSPILYTLNLEYDDTNNATV